MGPSEEGRDPDLAAPLLRSEAPAWRELAESVTTRG